MFGRNVPQHSCPTSPDLLKPDRLEQSSELAERSAVNSVSVPKVVQPIRTPKRKRPR